MTSWYDRSGPGADVFVSSRVRVARNLAALPFDSKLKAEDARALCDRVLAIFAGKEGYRTLRMDNLSRAEAMSLCERHYISREFATKKGPRALVIHEASGLSVMVCEEDHLRIQALATGLSAQECFRAAYETEALIGEAMEFAFDEKLGYLTHCPTNLGTAMRVSVMLFLPALTASGEISGLIPSLGQMGLTVRGMGGEGTEATGYLYQISNQVTLGISEEESLKKVTEAVRRIAKLERARREQMDEGARLRLADRAGRAEGIFRYAHSLSSSEFLKLWSDLRLGVSVMDKTDLDVAVLDKMLFEAMPYTVSLALPNSTEHLPEEVRRDLARAQAVRSILRSADSNPTKGR